MSNILFVGSECDPFVKTGGLADVMSALPRALANQGDLDVRVILPRYTCIPEHFRNNMTYVTHFYMDFTRDCHMYYVGLMEYWWNGVRFYFIDNEYFFGRGNPYTDMAGDIVPFIFFSKAVLASMCAIGFHPDVIHCHDWQAALVPVYLHTVYEGNPFYNGTKTVLTIHNLHFQGIANIDTVKYHSNIPEYAFSPDRLEFNADANIMKGGIVYSNFVTTVSHTYANEIRPQASNAISLKNNAAILSYTADASNRFWMLYSDSSNNTYLGNTSNGTIIRGSSISCANALSVSGSMAATGNIVRSYNNKDLVSLKVSSNAGWLHIQDTSGNDIASIYKSSNGYGILNLYDSSGGSHWLTPALIDNIPRS